MLGSVTGSERWNCAEGWTWATFAGRQRALKTQAGVFLGR